MTDPTHAFSRRRLLTGAMAATTTALALGLTGCGDSGESKAAASIPSTGTDDGATITMWSRAPLEKQATNAVKAYNASHKNQVKLSLLPNDDVEGKVGAAVQTDSLPDILAGKVVRIPYWAQQGIFTDLTKNIDGLADKADLQTGHIKAGTVDGKEYTLPFVTDISVMVWNKDLYKEAGLNPEKGPTTIAEFLAHATAVAKLGKKDVAGSYLAGQSGGALVFTLLPSVWASGQKAISDDGTKSLLDNAAAKSVYEAYATLAKLSNGLGAGSKEETGATWTAPFQNGKVGVMPYPATSVSALFKTSKFEIGVTPIPGVSGGSSTFLGGDAIGISKDCKKPAQAWNFLAWLMTQKAQQSVFADNNDTASNLKVLESGYTKADPRTQIANKTVRTGQTPIATNFNEAFNASGSPWQLLIQDAVWGDASKVAKDNTAITTALAG